MIKTLLNSFSSSFLILLILGLIAGEVAFAQTAGQIFRPSTGVHPTTGQLVLDPNGDGFVSKDTDGFTGGKSNDLTNTEIPFFALPSLNQEPVNDLRTGPKGGHTDFVDGAVNNAALFMYSDDHALYFRMRMAGTSNATKGYSFLISTGNTDFSNVPKNPGFDFEVVLQTGGGSPGVNLYNWSGGSPNRVKVLNLQQHHQRAISGPRYDTSANAYFYDFYVPWSVLNDELGLMTPSTSFRAAGVTITNAGSGISGVISDIYGVNDGVFKNPTTALTAILNSFPPTTANDLKKKGGGWIWRNSFEYSNHKSTDLCRSIISIRCKY